MLMNELIGQWLVKQQKRVELGKLKPASLAAFTSFTKNWITPHLGELDIVAVRNGRVKEFAEAIAATGRGPKTTREIVALVKQILESHVNEDGEPLLDLKWRSGFIFENISDTHNQKQPICTKEQLKDALKVRHTRTDKYRVIVALLAATGLRVGEVLALRCQDDGEHSGWDQEKSLLAIRTSLWNGVEQEPKTMSSVRLVDLSTPVNAMVATYAKTMNKNPADHLFATKSGRPYGPESLRQLALNPLGVPGFHSLRRWRVSYLKSIGTPDSLLKEWIGHSNGGDITALYDKSADDIDWRKKTVNRLGVGFELPTITVGHPAPKLSKPSKPSRIAKPSQPRTKFVATLVKRRKHRSVVERAEEQLSFEAASAAAQYEAVDSDLPELFSALAVAPVVEEVS